MYKNSMQCVLTKVVFRILKKPIQIELLHKFTSGEILKTMKRTQKIATPQLSPGLKMTFWVTGVLRRTVMMTDILKTCVEATTES